MIDVVAPMSGYRPWLDGVRAIAIVAVVAQHALGVLPVDIANAGVGLFFALSGYLITSLLVDERVQTGGVSLRAFYVRRAARLVPALVLVVVVCDVLFLLEGDRAPLKGSITALTYTTNYVLVFVDDFVHAYGPTWSLAVEEHFYLLWPPLLLWLLARPGADRMHAALRVTLGVCLGALAWRSLLAVLGAPLDLLALGSFERADAILYGCAAALALHIGWRPQPWVFWAGVVIVVGVPLGTSTWTGDALSFTGAYGLPVVATGLFAAGAALVVVGLDHAAPLWVQRVLSLRLLVRIGVLSYGIYLWHGPLMRLARDVGFDGRSGRFAAAGVAVVAAATSYRFVEAPIRAWARRSPMGRRPGEVVTVVQPVGDRP